MVPSKGIDVTKIKLSIKKSSLAGAQVLLDLEQEALKLKKKVNSLKGPNNSEIEEALDDATSSLDSFIHHMQDIYNK